MSEHSHRRETPKGKSTPQTNNLIICKNNSVPMKFQSMRRGIHYEAPEENSYRIAIAEANNEASLSGSEAEVCGKIQMFSTACCWHKDTVWHSKPKVPKKTLYR